jgi:hypothetical protein
LEDEIKAKNEKQAVIKRDQERSKSTAIVSTKTGTRLTNRGAAQQVVNNELQWKKMQQQAQMKAKGAVTSISLQECLTELLQERIEEMENDERHQPKRSTPQQQMQRASLASFAISLVV